MEVEAFLWLGLCILALCLVGFILLEIWVHFEYRKLLNRVPESCQEGSLIQKGPLGNVYLDAYRLYQRTTLPVPIKFSDHRPIQDFFVYCLPEGIKF